jgi:hypothetical protein
MIVKILSKKAQKEKRMAKIIIQQGTQMWNVYTFSVVAQL